MSSDVQDDENRVQDDDNEATVTMSCGLTTFANHCPSCGTTPVSYPLSTGPNCGNQSYKIHCDAGSLKFDTLNNTYSITTITPDIQRFIIQPSNFVPNTCVMCGLTTSANHCPSQHHPSHTPQDGPNCGDQSYKIRCDAGSLKFDTLNNTYSITTITPDIQRFVIQPSSFVPNTYVTSDISTMRIQMNSSLPFNITSSNTIMYLNCTTTLLSSPLNCSSTSLCHSFINSSAQVGVPRRHRQIDPKTEYKTLMKESSRSIIDCLNLTISVYIYVFYRFFF
ncbi:Wall-associated receptor kinase-like 15 [Camellia lanceoleosa]|uniref:Wall-associated receptor kinase-like 15 n=1 Tax=Camellia lanceoleosa TaxID=1840588 RepID=A0ACC0HAN0_9ERIC|nr:Wall-associated receptor kinase-like 15 [Camellia lanceoleosa]